MPPSNYSKIYAAIRRIPFGKVATYGQIAEVAGLPRQARLQCGFLRLRRLGLDGFLAIALGRSGTLG